MRRLFPLIAAVVLVDTMFYAAITPLLPHYVEDLGLSKSEAGILTASYAAGTLTGSMPGGWLAARAGGRRTVLVGLVLMALASATFAFASHVVLLDIARFVQGLGGACSWAGGMTWLIAAAPGGRRGELIGSALAAAVAGVLLGPVLGGTATLIGPEPVFSGVALLGLGLAAWALTIGERRPTETKRSTPVRQSLLGAPVVIGFWLVVLPALTSGVLNVLAPLRFDQLGASGVIIGVVFLTAAGFEALITKAVGALSDRRGRLAPIRIGLALSTATVVVLPLPGSVFLLALAVLFAVVALAFFWAPAMAWLSDVAESAGLDQGYAFALVSLAWAGGQVLGGSSGAALADFTSDAVPYMIVAGLSALTLGMLTFSRVAQRSSPSPQAVLAQPSVPAEELVAEQCSVER